MSRGTILFVDDLAPLCESVQIYLTREGYRVLTATSGEQALAVVSQPDVKIDALIVDMMMPGMNGRQLVHWIANQVGSVPVLYVSGVDADAAHHAGLARHAVFLQKPFLLEDLRARVEQMLPAEPAKPSHTT